MTADDWGRVEDIYHDALACAPEDRAQFLDEACAGDHQLRAELESLLAFSGTAEPFIEEPALNVAARLMATEQAAADASLIGRTIATFRVLSKIGEGGMGIVYEAEDTRLGRRVALKLLPARSATKPGALERVEREARAASALNHPHICTIYSVHDLDGAPVIAMERLEGETLRERVARGRLSADEVIDVALQLTDALEAAHAKGIVHRDLKPANIFMTAHGVKILDFGIARLDDSDDRQAMAGTPAYMAPEQATGEFVDARADLYSVGAVMFELATGSIFQGSFDALPPKLAPVVKRLLESNREQRFQSAAALRQALQRVRSAAKRRRAWLWAAAALLVAALAGTTAWRVALRPGDPFGSDLRLRQVTHNASEFSVRSGAISPDGRLVAYADPRGVHILELATSRTTPIAFDAPAGTLFDLSPGWLPGGERFVVNIGGPSESGWGVWLAGLHDAPVRLLEHASALSVSPDGKWIALAAPRGGFGTDSVSLMDVATREVRTFFNAEPGSLILELSWSPDSRRVAYGRADMSGHPVSIETRALDGGSPQTVVRTKEPDVLRGSAWLRDGRLLYSVTQPALGTSAGAVPCSHWQLRLDSQGRPSGSAAPLAGWLPQCVANISFTSDSKQALYLQFAVQDAIRIVDLDGAGASKRLTTTEGRNIPSGWTRDGRELIFVSDSAGSVALVRQPIDGTSASKINDDAGIFGAARLTADGDAVLFLVNAPRLGGGQILKRVSIAGGPSQELDSGQFVEGARCATAPATLCAIAQRSGDRRQLVFYELDPVQGRRGELLRVDIDPDRDYRWALSAIGREIALVDTSSPVIRVIALNGAPSQAIEVKGTRRMGYISWLPDSSGFLVPSYDEGTASLLAVFRDGRQQLIWQQPGALDVSGLASPDGRRVAVWVRTRNASLWLAQSP